MSIRNAASTDNTVGSRAVYVAPDNRGEITCCDNRGHTRSRINPNAAYPSPIEASILLLFSSGLMTNLFEQIMGRMRSGDVSDILGECHYDDRLWGYAIRTAETWRTSDREQWTLGAEGVLPYRQIESLLRVCNQFAPTLPSG